MSLDDLDLEFEDEEDEVKPKKGNEVSMDVELEFPVPEISQVSKQRPAPQGLPSKVEQVPKPQVSNVKKIEEARTQVPKRPTPTPQSPRSSAGNVSLGTSAVRTEASFENGSEEVVALREKIHQVEFDAEVKVQVAEFKASIMGELLGDMKLMEHQINQLLVKIHAKHPDTKQEALMIKKVLADFTTKKRK